MNDIQSLSSYVQLVLCPDMDPGKGVEESENIQQPKNYSDNNNCIQDGLDRSLHRYEAINEPKQQADHDQNYEYLK